MRPYNTNGPPSGGSGIWCTFVLLPFFGVVGGLILLVWSADKFVDGAAATANHLSVPPLLIGMVIVGFGTSAPEMVVSAIAASQGNAGLALGNAYGSNIANIALILGITALVCPIAVQSQVIKKENTVADRRHRPGCLPDLGRVSVAHGRGGAARRVRGDHGLDRL